MNFSPFGGHFSASIPSIHQFAAKLTHDASGGFPPQAGSVVVGGGESTRYHSTPAAHFANQHPIAVPVNMGKYSRPDTNNQVSHATTTQTLTMLNSNHKYHTSSISGHHFAHTNSGAVYQNPVQQQQQQQQQQQTQNQTPGQSRVPTTSAQTQQQQQQQQQQTMSHNKRPYHPSDMQQAQDLCNAMMSDAHKNNDKSMETKREEPKEERPSSGEVDYGNAMSHGPTATMPPSWQSLATPGSTVADYLSHLPASTLPLSLHHFLKYSAENIKKEAEVVVANTAPAKKKKKKKPPKEKKPRPKPGEIRLTTALDGSTLYCCPECHMAYPEKELLEQHLVGHKLERRFICDICGAGLKRKDHLTRHKQSHNPDRPFVCTICMKAFKRKEQLTLHFVIHSGEKRHVCSECGKGFYRKDHLRKHTRSHIARRVKAEMTQHSTTSNNVPTAATGMATGHPDGPPPPLLS